MAGLTVPLVVDGPINSEVFLAYVEQKLVKTLKPGNTNLSNHKHSGIRQAIEAIGARLVYLPPYSPDLNPIELAFAKLKALLNQAAKRTVAKLETTIGHLIKNSNAKIVPPTSRTADTPHVNLKML